MTKRIVIAVVAGLLGANLIFGAKIYSEASSRADRENPYSQMELLTQVMELIRKDYVDSDKVAYTNLTYGALKGMLNSLDPHSQFMDPQGYQDMKEDTEGKFDRRPNAAQVVQESRRHTGGAGRHPAR